MMQSNWINPTNATIPRKGRKTSFITEQSYFFLAKNKKKQRMMLTEDTASVTLALNSIMLRTPAIVKTRLNASM